jgi:hypothetical protein
MGGSDPAKCHPRGDAELARKPLCAVPAAVVAPQLALVELGDDREDGVLAGADLGVETVEPLDQLGLATAVVVHARTPSPGRMTPCGRASRRAPSTLTILSNIRSIVKRILLVGPQEGAEIGQSFIEAGGVTPGPQQLERARLAIEARLGAADQTVPN